MKNQNVILITGASSGIGRELALLYAQKGVKLLLTGRNAERLSEVEQLCRDKGAAVKTCTLCVTEDVAFQKQIEAWDDMEPIDLVIANAGISGGTEANFREIVATNLHGTFNTVEPLIPRMRARKRGQIVLMSSMAGWRGMPNAPAYSTAKVAIRAYGEALRPLLKKDGVDVSVIFPGFVKTPLTDVNKFPMPFLMDAPRAAKIIKNNLEKNKARIAFPWPMHVLSRLVAALPLCLGDFILGKAPKK